MMRLLLKLLIGLLLLSFSFPEKDLKNEFVFVEGGSFVLKDFTDESEKYWTENEVKVESFYISKFEVTHKQYIEFLNSIGCDNTGVFLDPEFGEVDYILIQDHDCPVAYKNGKFVFEANEFIPSANCPVVMVTWFGANAYCNWAGVRLPSEKEWEFAARGGVRTKGYLYSGSDSIDEVAWYVDNAEEKVHAVGLKKPNELGIYDMSGNVWEWCSDWYFENKHIDKADRPKNFSDTDNVLRGGSWFVHKHFCTNDFRLSYSPKYASLNYGFRVAKDK